MGFNLDKRFWNIVLTVSAVLFFVGSLYLWMKGRGVLFVSPDETANAWFIQLFASQGTVRSFDVLNTVLHDSIHPRSMIVVNGWMMPVGFLGLTTLYGSLVAVLGKGILPLITPVVALLAVFAFRKLIAQWFDEQIANITTVVLLFHPALWYYTARSLMPNVLFVSLLVFAAFCWFRRFKQPFVSVILSGCFLGLAVFVRASEVYWIAFVCLGLIVGFWKTLSKQDLYWFVLGGLIGIAPLFITNVLTYGNALLTGYTLPAQVTQTAVVSTTTSTTSLFLFPFGVDPNTFLKTILSYGILLFWWLSILTLIGLVASFTEKQFKKTSLLAYVWVFVGVSVWLGVWYGSWVIHDNPDPTQVTIANSYVRYWLAVFVLSTPFIAQAIQCISKRSKQIWMMPVLLLLIACSGIFATFFSGQDGLMSVGQTLVRSVSIREEVLSLVESESLIIVDRADKLFFPHRVLYPLRSEQTYQLMPRAVENVPLYYYGITLPPVDLAYLNNQKLKELGLKIEHLKTFDVESLYRISKP